MTSSIMLVERNLQTCVNLISVLVFRRRRFVCSDTCTTKRFIWDHDWLFCFFALGRLQVQFQKSCNTYRAGTLLPYTLTIVCCGSPPIHRPPRGPADNTNWMGLQFIFFVATQATLTLLNNRFTSALRCCSRPAFSLLGRLKAHSMSGPCSACRVFSFLTVLIHSFRKMMSNSALVSVISFTQITASVLSFSQFYQNVCCMWDHCICLNFTYRVSCSRLYTWFIAKIALS